MNKTIYLVFLLDGDLRRLIDKQQGFDVNLPVSEVMTKKPSTISQEARAVEALQQLNQKKIQSVCGSR